MLERLRCIFLAQIQRHHLGSFEVMLLRITDGSVDRMRLSHFPAVIRDKPHVDREAFGQAWHLENINVRIHFQR
jgi:hypothetical protein